MRQIANPFMNGWNICLEINEPLVGKFRVSYPYHCLDVCYRSGYNLGNCIDGRWKTSNQSGNGKSGKGDKNGIN